MRMGAQTEKIKEGGLGCANRVRKGFLGGVGCAKIRSSNIGCIQTNIQWTL